MRKVIESRPNSTVGEVAKHEEIRSQKQKAEEKKKEEKEEEEEEDEEEEEEEEEEEYTVSAVDKEVKRESDPSTVVRRSSRSGKGVRATRLDQADIDLVDLGSDDDYCY